MARGDLVDDVLRTWKVNDRITLNLLRRIHLPRLASPGADRSCPEAERDEVAGRGCAQGPLVRMVLRQGMRAVEPFLRLKMQIKDLAPRVPRCARDCGGSSHRRPSIRAARSTKSSCTGPAPTSSGSPQRTPREVWTTSDLTPF